MRPGIARCATALLAGCLLVAACGGDDGEGDASGPTLPPATATDEAPPPGRPPLAEVQVTPTEVATADEPLALVAVRGTGTLLVGERGGRVRALLVRGEGSDRSYELVDEPVLDIAEEVTTSGSEQGLLDIEPTPDGTTLYVSYSVAATGATRVVAYPLTVRGDGPPTVDTGAVREVVTVEQPASNHNGGDVEVGPDGYLYVTLGDGGGSGDQFDNAQDPAELLGSILRIDPTAPGGPGGTDGYGIPPDNPFADGGTGRPEVWLYGVRNPWRLTFDPETDDLWVADVGQGDWEEVDLLPATPDGAGRGANLGWPLFEGTHAYRGDGDPAGTVLPVFEYGHDEGCSITGGVVYRGGAVEALTGAYLFSDYCTGTVRALRVRDGRAVDEQTLTEPLGQVASFGVDGGGDVYVVTLDGLIIRLDP